MLYGLLLDKYNEFFVQKAPTKTSDTADDKTDGVGDDNELGLIGGLTGKQLKKVLVCRPTISSVYDVLLVLLYVFLFRYKCVIARV